MDSSPQNQKYIFLCIKDFSNIMGLNAAVTVVLTAPKYIWKRCHRPCCEQFYVSKKVVPVSKKVVPTWEKAEISQN